MNQTNDEQQSIISERKQTFQVPFFLFVLSSIILLILGIIVGWYLGSCSKNDGNQQALISPSINPTDSIPQRGNLYINEQAGFSVEFPIDWVKAQNVYTTSPAGEGAPGIQHSKNGDGVTNPSILISSEEYTDQKNDRALVQLAENGCSWIMQDSTNYSTKEIVVDGHRAAYLENIRLGSDFTGKYYYYACILIDSNPTYWRIVWHNDGKDKGDLDSILTSFKFLNATSK